MGRLPRFSRRGNGNGLELATETSLLTLEALPDPSLPPIVTVIIIISKPNPESTRHCPCVRIFQGQRDEGLAPDGQ